MNYNVSFVFDYFPLISSAPWILFSREVSKIQHVYRSIFLQFVGHLSVQLSFSNCVNCPPYHSSLSSYRSRVSYFPIHLWTHTFAVFGCSPVDYKVPGCIFMESMTYPATAVFIYSSRITYVLVWSFQKYLWFISCSISLRIFNRLSLFSFVCIKNALCRTFYRVQFPFRCFRTWTAIISISWREYNRSKTISLAVQLVLNLISRKNVMGEMAFESEALISRECASGCAILVGAFAVQKCPLTGNMQTSALSQRNNWTT